MYVFTVPFQITQILFFIIKKQPSSPFFSISSPPPPPPPESAAQFLLSVWIHHSSTVRVHILYLYIVLLFRLGWEGYGDMGSVHYNGVGIKHRFFIASASIFYQCQWLPGPYQCCSSKLSERQQGGLMCHAFCQRIIKLWWSDVNFAIMSIQ